MLSICFDDEFQILMAVFVKCWCRTFTARTTLWIDQQTFKMNIQIFVYYC